MNRATNITLQILGIVAQVLVWGSSIVPPKYQPVVSASAALCQAVVGVIAHSYNPDGTPAVVK